VPERGGAYGFTRLRQGGEILSDTRMLRDVVHSRCRTNPKAAPRSGSDVSRPRHGAQIHQHGRVRKIILDERQQIRSPAQRQRIGTRQLFDGIRHRRRAKVGKGM
jgi:hypothetical protein